MINSNLPPEDNDEFDLELLNHFETPEENVFIYSSEPVNLLINISDSSINVVNPTKQAYKLYAMLKTSLDIQTWEAFLGILLSDPDLITKLIKNTRN